MTVRELKEKLEDLPLDFEIMVRKSTYVPIQDRDPYYPFPF